MRKMLTGLAILAVLGFAGKSEAQVPGTISMNWDSCTGPVDKAAAGAISYTLNVSVLGIDFAHKAYDIKVIYGDGSQQVPDSWRFDAAGCQTSSQITLNHISKACAAMMQTSSPSLQVKDVSFVPDTYAGTLMRITVANTYPNGVVSVNPATRYFLCNFIFDHSASVDGATTATECGNFVDPICFKVSNGTVLDLNSIEYSFSRPGGVVAASFLPASTVSPCAAVPASAKTWGQIKSQYRN